MANFHKFKKLRIDLDEVYAFYTNIPNKREKGWVDKILIYTKPKKGDYFEVHYDTVEENTEFKAAVSMLDELFEVKTEAEAKILP